MSKKYEFKRKTDRRELGDVEKGRIIAFFVAFGIVQVEADPDRKTMVNGAGVSPAVLCSEGGLDEKNLARSGR